MSSSVMPARVRKPRRLRRWIASGATAVTLSGVAVTGLAAPAQAMPRSCNDIANTILFFELALQMDTGPYARYYDSDLRYWNYEVRLYYASGC